MRILLDENMDHRLRHAFDKVYEVITVRNRGWGGKKNGDLLSSAEAEFDVLVTLDTNMRFQQNLSQYNLAFVLITAPSNRRSDILPAMPEVNAVLPRVESGQLYIVSAMDFPRFDGHEVKHHTASVHTLLDSDSPVLNEAVHYCSSADNLGWHESPLPDWQRPVGSPLLRS